MTNAPTAIVDVPLGQIRAGNNDRTAFEPRALEGLAESIRELGLLQPITVRPCSPDLDGTTFEIIAGERRFRASQLLGNPTIPAIIREALSADDRAASLAMLVENVQRADLDPIEEAGMCHMTNPAGEVLRAGFTVRQWTVSADERHTAARG